MLDEDISLADAGGRRIPESRILWNNALVSFGVNFFVREIKCSGDAILARGDLPDCAFDLDYYGEDFTLRADSMADRFELDAAMPSADGLPPREINARIREILASV